MYKVLAKPSYSKNAYRTFMEFLTLDEALATAARLEKNTGMLVLVEMPSNAIQPVPLRLLELTA